VPPLPPRGFPGPPPGSGPLPRGLHRRRGRALTVLAAAGVLLATGCGTIAGSIGGTGDSPEPVTVMTFAPERTRANNMPGMPAMAAAYARWVNSRGGIDGHELRVITCNERNTRTGAADCAERAVREKVDAVVGSYSQHGNDFLAPLRAAGIPFIGGYGVSVPEFTSHISYPVNGGKAALLAGHGMQLAEVCRRVALVRPDSLAGDELPLLLDAGLSAGGSGRATDILAPDDATDYTARAARALDRAGRPGGTGGSTVGGAAGHEPGGGADSGDGPRPGCVTAALGERTETFFDSYRRLPDDGRRVRVGSVLGSVDQSLINRTGGRGGIFEGAFVTGWYPDSADSRWTAMRQVIEGYAFGDDRIDPADPGVQTTWIAYTVLSAVVTALDTNRIDPRTITRVLDGGLTVDTGGLTPDLRWGRADVLGTPRYPRAVNRSVTFQSVRDGRLVAQRPGFVEVSRPMSAAAVG
jgi:hypothetical protein